MSAASTNSSVFTGQAKGRAWRWVGLIGILSIAVMRCVTVFSPQAMFDTDPATDLIPLGGLAQAGSLWLDVAMILSCALAMFGEWLCGRRFSILACVFALAPIPVILWHGAHDAGNLWRGGTWAAGAIACVTIAHLARDPRMRIVIAAILLAVLAPLVVRGVGQITWEHADTVKAFEATKNEFFQQRGWSPDSSAAKIYERRLRQPQPTGWFTTSNIFASVMMFGMIASLGLMVGAIRSRMESGWAAAMGLCCVAATAMLLFTGSKGAILAALIGATVAVLPLISSRIGRIFASRIGDALVIALVLLGLAAIVVRGTLLPESFAGEKSLLFRWHYMEASARMIADHPWVGVGPDGIQDAYMLHRVPRNPEEVQSAHSMFLDWTATLGIPAGAAWIALIMSMLARSSLPLRIDRTDNRQPEKGCVRTAVWSTLAVIAIGFVPAFIVESGTLDPRSVLMRAVGLGAFGAAALLAAMILARSDERVTRWFFAAAAVAVVLHGQIEMTFHQPGSVVWAMCALGLAGTFNAATAQPRRSGTQLAVPLLLFCAAVWLIIGGAVPATRRECVMSGAAQTLRSHVHDPAALANARRLVARDLIQLCDGHRPPDPFLRLAAARQLEIAASEAAAPTKLELFNAAVEALTAPCMAGRSAAKGLRVGLLYQISAATNDQMAWQQAVDSARDATESDPNGLSAWKRYGDICWAAGNRERAGQAYHRALECDANFALDAFKQLSDHDRNVIQSRIVEASRDATTRP